MSRIVAFLRSNALLGVACVFVLWPIVFVARFLIWGATFAPLLFVAAVLVLWTVFGVRNHWRQRRRGPAVFLAFVLAVPYGALHLWLVDTFLDSRARDRVVRSFHEGVVADRQVAVLEVVSGWSTVCACIAVESDAGACYVGHGAHKHPWKLEFYHHSSGESKPDLPFLQVPMPGMANISPPRTNCFTLDQAPVISRDPLFDDLLTLMARPSPTAPAK